MSTLMYTEIAANDIDTLDVIVTRPFMLRVGGLPFDVVDTLRFEQTQRAAAALFAIEQTLAERKEKLVQYLEQTVAAHSDNKKQRSKLLNLKRDVYNLRPIRSRGKIKAILTTLPEAERALLQEWLTLWQGRDEILEKTAVLFTQELQQNRSRLKQIFNTPDFRKGLLLASPKLSHALDNYLFKSRLNLNKRLRQSERSLLSYLLRMACKTSPFSTFTPVCFGIFTANTSLANDSGIVYEITNLDKQSFVRLNMAILSRISSLILASNKLRSNLPVQMVSGWQIENNRLRYLRKRQNLVETADDSPFELNMLHENVFYLPYNQLLQALIDVLVEKEEVRLNQLVVYISQIAEYKGAEAEIEAYLNHLLRLGFLFVPNLRINIHSKYPLADYYKNLTMLAVPEINKIGDRLREIDAQVTAYAELSVNGREKLLKQLRENVAECYLELEGARGQVPKTLLYEDTTVSASEWTISEATWRTILADLKEWQQLLPLFDINLPRRLMLKGFFQARYGIGSRCNDFLSFATEFHRDFFENYIQATGNFGGRAGATDSDSGTRHRNFFDQPEIEQINTAEQVMTEYVRILYEEAELSGEEITLKGDFFTRLQPYVPNDVIQIHTNAYFAQFVHLKGMPRLIINRIYSGGTLMFSRFAHFFAVGNYQALIPMLQAELLKYQPDGAVFAELKGGHDATNLNLHPWVTPYEIVCPGEFTSRPEAEQIPLEDLYVQDDMETNRLRLYSRRLRKEIIPLYLGFLLPMSLPEVQQVLLQFSPASLCPVDLWRGIKSAKVEGKIVYYPRLCYKSLILQRAHWRIRDGFPLREPRQTDLDFFINVSRWQRKNNLPTRAFILPDMSRIEAEEVKNNTVTNNNNASPNYKPLYVDFHNLFSVLLLETNLRTSAGRFTLTEMLPDQDQLWLKHENHDYVAEFVFEVSDVN